MDLDETWQVGLRPEKTKPSTFPAKSRYGFRRQGEKMGRRGVAFCDVNYAPLLPLSFDRFPPNFPRIYVSTVQVVVRDTWFHIPERFPLRDRISRKNLFLGYAICDQATGHGKRSATPTLFPSPGGHPTDVPYLGDFCCPPPTVILFHSISNGDAGMPIIFSNPLARWRHGSDRRFAVVTNPLHVF